MYCGRCAKIKSDSEGELSKVLDGLYLSGMDVASSFKGMRLCVYDWPPTYGEPFIHIPILTTRPNSATDRSGAVASIEQLDRAAEIIDQYQRDGNVLLVHCHGGVERSPLTVAWYLRKFGKYSSLEEAYTFLQSKRAVVSNRLFWLPVDR